MIVTATLSRSTEKEIECDYLLIRQQEYLTGLFDAVSAIGFIANDNRQIVFAGQEFLRFLGIPLQDVMGKKPGEVFGCIHADSDPRGCGAAESCRFCGAVKTFLECLKGGKKAQNDARITTASGGVRKSWDFRVTAVPFTIQTHMYTVVTLQDIGDEMRRNAWERIFFHDVMNTAGSLKSALEICSLDDIDEAQREELLSMCRASSRSLVDEINMQRQIRAAETERLDPSFEELSVESAVRGTVEALWGLIDGAAVTVDVSNCAGSVYSDRILLQRVLGNMLKNAIEAAPEGSVVTVGAHRGEQHVRFMVHNEGVIPPETGMQIFQRSFSTKGKNRGLGTYSMKLIGEEYLGGRVDFDSTERDGTTFYIDLPQSVKS